MAANGRCFGMPGFARYETQIARIDRDDLLYQATLVIYVVEQRGESPIAVIQPE